MKYENKTVNENGLKQIADFLAEKHKLGGDHFNKSMLRAWAEDAEKDQESPHIEIRSLDANSGHTEILFISDDGIDIEIIDDGDDE